VRDRKAAGGDAVHDRAGRASPEHPQPGEGDAAARYSFIDTSVHDWRTAASNSGE